MSPGLWHKLLLAGMEHTLLWTLSRSFPGRVSLVIPAAFVGFEQLSRLVSEIGTRQAAEVDILAAGEDSSYTAEELAVLSSQYQMGSVSREDVTRVVMDILTGSDTTHDILRAMTGAALRGSITGHLVRDHVIGWLRSGHDGAAPALTRGALGRRVSRGLILLAVLKANWTEPLWNRLTSQTSNDMTQETVLPEVLVEQAESAGFSITTEHPSRTPSGLCLCAQCFQKVGGAVLDRLRHWYDTASAADRLQLRELADRPDWSEGDVLAILWHDVGSELMPF